jgi:hypothetical protein
MSDNLEDPKDPRYDSCLYDQRKQNIADQQEISDPVNTLYAAAPHSYGIPASSKVPTPRSPKAMVDTGNKQFPQGCS